MNMNVSNIAVIAAIISFSLDSTTIKSMLGTNKIILLAANGRFGLRITRSPVITLQETQLIEVSS